MGANFNFNKSFIGGRLTHDVEMRKTASGISVCTFSVAVNRNVAKDSEKQVDFIDCQAWRSTADFIAKYFKKGSSIFIVGSIQKRSWTNNNGQKQYITEVVVDEARFVDGRSDSDTASSEDTVLFNDTSKSTQSGFLPIDDVDDDLPF